MKYHIIKDLIILAAILIVGLGVKMGYDSVQTNHDRMKSFEKSLAEMGTGISIDNQRKAKIAKATDMILSRNKQLPYEVAMNYAEWFVDESDRYTNVDFVLLISIASQESAFKYKAYSNVGAAGLMQLMPGTAADMCEYLRMSYADSIRFDPKTNIRLGARLVNKLMTRFDNDTLTVIAAYNGGEGGGAKYQKGLPIFEETKNYIPLVLAYKRKYEKML